VRLALRGLRNMDSGNEKVQDSMEKRALQQQARKVYLQSFVAAAVLTAVVAALPVGSAGS
jgi:hypothetical protein